MTYIRSWNAWYRYIFQKLISAYCSWWWKVEMPDISVYLCHYSVRTVAVDVLYLIWKAWYRYAFLPLISAYWNWWWLVLKFKTSYEVNIYTINQSVLQLMMNYIWSRSAWYRYTLIPLISAYCIWWWLMLEAKTFDIAMYLYH